MRIRSMLPAEWWFGALLACSTLPGCRVSPPTPEQVRAYGFDTPVQAFQSFVVALRAQWPQDEYRCFSSTFKERNSLSRLGYLEFRDHLLESQPLLRWALARATRHPEAYHLQDLEPGRLTKLEVTLSGRTLVVLLRREDYFAMYGAPENPLESAELWVDDNVRDLEQDHYLYVPEDKSRLIAQVPYPDRDLDRLVALKVGREWKIEDLYVMEERKVQP